MTKSKIPVSVVIFTKNEERNIEACIRSASTFDEIVVLDSNSVDKTVDIANSLGVRAVNFTWNGRYPKKRQWTLDYLDLAHDWILFLDADERVTQELALELDSIFKNNELEFAAAKIRISYYFNGRQLKYGIKPQKIVLLNRRFVRYAAIEDEGISGMGELEGHFQPSVSGKLVSLNSYIAHKDQDPILDWFSRHVRYAEWESNVETVPKLNRVVNANKSMFARFFHKLPAKPFFFFISCYFLFFGFLDGKAGFRYSLAKSWYYWLVQLSKDEMLSIRKSS